MRKYIRHPSDIPIRYNLSGVIARKKNYLNNISHGGISFHSKAYIKPESPISIRIPLVKSNLKIRGLVVWCHKKHGYHDVGVKFTDMENEFRIRMVEQLCYIEHYKQEILHKEGRRLSGEAAAKEWIEKYAQDFPAIV